MREHGLLWLDSKAGVGVNVHDFREAQADGMTEAELLANVRALARQLGWKSYHTHDSRRSEPGFPDLVLARPGRVLVRELKSERGYLTKPQLAWIGLLCSAGVDVGTWRPRDLLEGRVLAELTVYGEATA